MLRLRWDGRRAWAPAGLASCVALAGASGCGESGPKADPGYENGGPPPVIKSAPENPRAKVTGTARPDPQ